MTTLYTAVIVLLVVSLIKDMTATAKFSKKKKKVLAGTFFGVNFKFSQDSVKTGDI